MKKILSILLITISVFMFAQNKEFSQSYNNYAFKRSSDKDFTIKPGKVFMVFNVNGGNSISLNFPDKSFIFQMTSDSRKGGTYPDTYQEVNVTDGQKDAIIIVYDDYRYGCLIIYRDIVFGVF